MNEATLNTENGSATMTGDLTFDTVSSHFNKMQTIANKVGIPGRIDLAGVKRIDSAGLALLLEWQMLFRKQEGPAALIDISNPPGALLKIARLCDAEAFLADSAPAGKNNADNDK